MQAAVVAIGDELLAGRTQDRHVAYLARRLGALGVDLVEARVVADTARRIQLAVWELQERRQARIVIATGGLGPTHDDRTAAAIAALHGVPLIEDAATRQRIEARAAARGARTAPGARRMALVPAGARVWPNPAGTAPGFAIERALLSRAGHAWTVVLPGVPEELRALWTAHAEPFLTHLVGVRALTVHVELVCHAPEADVAPALAALQAEHAEVRIGSYPRYGERRITLRVSGADPRRVEAAAAAVRSRLRAAGVRTDAAAPPNA